MAKQYFDLHGKEIKVGSLIMFSEDATAKGSRPDMMFSKVYKITRGCATIEKKYVGQGYDTNIRLSSTRVRVVTEQFKDAWLSGNLF